MIDAVDGYGRFSGCPTGIPDQRCVPGTAAIATRRRPDSSVR